MNGASGSQQEKFTGTIYGVQLADLVQLACLCQMNVSIYVKEGTSSSAAGGVIHIQAGHVVDAVAGAARSEEAFKTLVLFAGGRFLFGPLADDVGSSITRSWEYLLIDAFRYRTARPGPTGEFEHAFFGKMKNVDLLDVVQLACIAKTDQVLRIECGPETGAIYVRGGQIYHAQYRELAGEDAFKEVLLVPEGSFEAVPSKGEESDSIATPWEYLLMEATRYRDERSGEKQEGEESEFDALTHRIQKMKVAEKIRLATTGDKEARTLLMRDSNRMVQIAIISNPRITDGEVALIAGLRSVDEDVLRRIANTREWLKMYQVRLALATNPKCAFPAAAKQLQSLSAADLKSISRSKSVPNNIAQMARRLLGERV